MQSIAFFLLALCSLLIPTFAKFLFPRLTLALLKDLRLLRVFHYLTLSVFGAVLFVRSNANPLSDLAAISPIQQFVLLAFSLTYAAVFAIVTNNIEDIEADRLTNTHRPLVMQTVFRREYLAAGVFCLLWSLVIAGFIGLPILLGILTISFGYFFYSCRPLRLKRIPVLAKSIIGFNSWVASLCGFFLMGGELHNFPPEWLLFILVPLSLAANFIDLKDTEGDRKAGVKTLPVLMGEPRARLIIAIASVASYAMASCFVNLLFVYILAGSMALLHVYFLYRKPYREAPVFVVYILSIWALIVILVFRQQFELLS